MNCLLSHFLISSVSHYDKWLLIYFLGFPGASVVNNPPANVGDTDSMGQEGPLEKEMATHSSILAGKSQGQRSLVGHSPWGHKSVGHDLATKQQKILVLITFY